MHEIRRDPRIDSMVHVVLTAGGNVTHDSHEGVETLIAEFPTICFSYKHKDLDKEDHQLNWYSQSLPLNEAVFDYVNPDHRRRATTTASELDTLLERLRGVLKAIGSGEAFVQ